MGETERAVPVADIYVEGSRAPVSVDDSLITVVVDSDTDLSTSIRITLNNEGHPWSDGDFFKEGKKVKVDLGYEDDEMSTVAEGEVVARRAIFPMRGPRHLEVVCHDLEHRLKRQRHARSFLQVSFSDVASTLASEAGLSADVEATQPVFEYVCQTNQSNLELLRRLASIYGYEVEVANGSKLLFKSAKTSSGPVATLVRGQTLTSFRPRVTLSNQVREVYVRGWLPKDKAPLLGKAQKGDLKDKLGTTSDGPSTFEQYLGSVGCSSGETREVVVDHPVFSQAEADTHAKALLNRRALEYVSGEGTAVGNPKVLTGSIVELKGLGKRFNGKYYITAARHVYQKDGYTTYFHAVRTGVDVPETVPAPPPQQQPPQPPPPAPGISCSWSKSSVKIGGKVDIIVPVKGIEDGQSVAIDIYKKKGPSFRSAGFSKKTAAPGETVDLKVSCENLDDGAKVKIKLMKKPAGEEEPEAVGAGGGGSVQGAGGGGGGGGGGEEAAAEGGGGGAGGGEGTKAEGQPVQGSVKFTLSGKEVPLPARVTVTTEASGSVQASVGSDGKFKTPPVEGSGNIAVERGG